MVSRRPCLAFALAFVSLAATSACSFVFSPNDLEKNAGNTFVPDDTEAGADADLPPANSDASPDARSALDASADGSSDAGFCASLSPAPAFCRDFDLGGAVASADWDVVTTDGTLAVDDATSISPRFSMRAQSADTVPGRRCSGMFTAKQGPTHIKATLDFRWDTLTTAFPMLTFTGIEPSGEHREVVFLLSDTDAAQMVLEQVFPSSASSQAEQHPSAFVIAKKSTWTHIEAELVIGSPTTFHANADGRVIDITLTSAWSPVPVGVHFGVNFVGIPSKAFEFHYDNLVVETY